MAQTDSNQDVKAEAKDLLEPTTAVGKRLLKQRIVRLSSPQSKARIAALEELSTCYHFRAMLPMTCTLLNEKDLNVRKTAAKMLAHKHDAAVLLGMRIAAVLERDKKLKLEIRKHLVRMRTQVDDLIKQLKSSNVKQRIMAIRLLGQAVYPSAQNELIATLKDKDTKVRQAAVAAVSQYLDSPAIAALKAAATDPSLQVRRSVKAFFKKNKKRRQYREFFRDANRVVMKTTDASPIWRSDAAIVLGISGAEKASGTLAQLLLHDKVEAVRLAAGWSLVLMASERGEIALKKAAEKDPSEKVRFMARKYLVIDKVNIDDLIEQLTDKSAAIRLDAAEALSLKPKRKVLSPMIRSALCDTASEVRIAALRGLARINEPLAHTAIRVSLKRDSSKQVRRVAFIMDVLASEN